MPSYVLTGAPGAGKTAILRLLEVSGYAVVAEAATDVIALGQALGDAEPWQSPDFIGKVIALQRQRQRQDAARIPREDAPVFFDRSPACTLALARYLGRDVSPSLEDEVGQVLAEGGYERQVFFIRNLGFVEPTAARRITYEDSLAFERVHEQVYRDLGFQLTEVPPGPLAARAALIQEAVTRPRRPGRTSCRRPGSGDARVDDRQAGRRGLVEHWQQGRPLAQPDDPFDQIQGASVPVDRDHPGASTFSAHMKVRHRGEPGIIR